MFSPIVHKKTPLTVLGGAYVSPSVLKICLNLAPHVVAADGGADVALAHDLSPLAVIGDLDSISDGARAAFGSCLHHNTDTDTTDFEKVLQAVQAPLYLGVGFLGGRLDHSLSVLNTMARYADARVLLLSDDDVVTLVGPDPLRLHLPVGTRLGLMPLEAAQVTTTGLQWNLENATLHPSGKVSSSNAVASEWVTIRAQGAVLLTVPLAALDAVTDAVRAE